MLSSTEFIQTHSPGQALRASLSASGLLHHHAGLREGTSHESARAIAHAVHQGDRLLRTARALLIVHAQTHGDLCSLWAGDGPDVVAVICAPGVITPLRVIQFATDGSRLSVGVEAIRLQEPVGTDNPLPLAMQAEQGAWSALFRLALRNKSGIDDDIGSRLLASVLPWRPCPMVLMTIDAGSAIQASPRIGSRSAHDIRHTSLGQCLTWALDAVVN